MAKDSTNIEHAVAIIGLACRFPGDADNAERFWELLCNGRSTYSESSRFNADAFCASDKAKLNTSSARGGHFLSQDVAAFDANFFSISENEARAMDPQARIMLEIAYEAFENAGLAFNRIMGTDTSCFVGNFTTDYREMLLRDPDFAPLYTLSGSGQETISNRISWFYDLQGASVTLGTACSSSLVALHLACESIRTGDSNMSLVGGSNLLLNPDMFMMLSNMQFLAQDGKCKSFDAKGDGYGRGEGFAAIILKQVDQAVRDGDPIRAIIRGTGVNQNGKSKGITNPSGVAQAKLIRSTYLQAGLDFKNTRYVEAHGTGTKAGDPAEMEGIAKTLANGESILVGSVKANIGHLEATAGLAGLIKAIFVLERGLIPPNIYFDKPNPQIPFEEWKVSVPTQLTKYPGHSLRRVSVQCFGYGGTNAHTVLDDALHYLAENRLPGVHRTKALSSTHVNGSGCSQSKLRYIENSSSSLSEEIWTDYKIFVVSAHDQDGISRQKQALCRYLLAQGSVAKMEDQVLRDLAFTLGERRSRLMWRTFSVASSIQDLVSKLQSNEPSTPIFRSSTKNRVAYIFTGQGAQWARMGEELNRYPKFRQSIEQSDRFLQRKLGCSWSVAQEMRLDAAESRINSPEFAQPICTVLQIALVDLLASWNINPSAVVGHSSGEIAAAYCLGALNREDALQAAYSRGSLSSRIKSFSRSVKGAMLAVGASESQAQSWIDDISGGNVVVACVNSPSSVTLSGDACAIDELQAKLGEREVFARKLKVETAYHSPHMNMVAMPYLESMNGIRIRTDCDFSIKMYSAVTGCFVEPSELGAVYWVRNLISPVLFYDAIYDLMRPLLCGHRSTENSIDILLELGPHSTLQGAVNQTMKKHGITGIAYQSVLKRGRDAMESALDAAGFLAAQNVPIDLNLVNNASDVTWHAPPPQPLVDLPPYCWNHSSAFWAESRVSKEYRFREQPRVDLLGVAVPKMNEAERTWRAIFRISEQAWIQDHVIQTSIIYPAAGYLAMALEGANQIAAGDVKGFRFREVQIVAPAVISDTTDLECILQFRPHRNGTRGTNSMWTEFSISSCSDGTELRLNCYGLLLIEYENIPNSNISVERNLEDDGIKESYHRVEQMCTVSEDPRAFYEELDSIGLRYGSTFRNLTQVRRGQGKSCFILQLFDPNSQAKLPYMSRPHVIHPTNMDSMFHAAFAAYKDITGPLKETMVPTSIDEIFISAKIPFLTGTSLKGFCETSKHGFRELMADMAMLDADIPVLTVKGFRCSAVSGSDSSQADAETSQLFGKMVWKPATEFLDTIQVSKIMATASPTAEVGEHFKKCERLAFLFVQHALKEVGSDCVLDQRLQELRAWMQEQLEANIDANWTRMDCAEAQDLIEELKEGSADGLMLCKTGEHLVQVLQGQADVETVLRKDGVLDRWLKENEGLKQSLTNLAKFIELLAHENPGMSILDLGVADGGAASFVVSHTINEYDGRRPMFHYVLAGRTEVDSKAYEEYEDLKKYVDLRKISANKDPESQGLEPAYFDVVIISTLGAIEDLDRMLTNIKAFLKPEGKLCIVSIENPGLSASLIMRCLQASSREKTAREYFTQIQSKVWESTLVQHGFVPQFLVTGPEDEIARDIGISVSKLGTSVPTDVERGQVAILEARSPTDPARAVADQLAAELEKNSFKPQRIRWGSNLDKFQGEFCVSLVELDTPMLENVGEEDFLSVKQLIRHASGLIWVTSLNSPAGALSVGMARSIRNELPGKSFRVLSVQPESVEVPNRIAPLLMRLLVSTTSESEFLEKDGVAHICRVVEDGFMSEQMARTRAEQKERLEPFPLEEVRGPHKLVIRAQGTLDSLCIESDDAQAQIADDEVVIAVRATGLNFRDVMVVMGQIPDNLLGFDASGVITSVGRQVSSFKPGDKVCTLGHGAHRTSFRNKAAFCQMIPDGLSFEEAATLPLVHCTAFYALVHIARVQPKQTVLIHAAAGGVGQAAIQIAKIHKAEIFATVGSAEKRKLINDLYGIPEDHIFSSRDLSFSKGILRMTKGRGVDCILNSLSGQALQESWRCIAPFGTFIEIGLKDILSNSSLEMRPFMQDASFTFTNLKHVMTANPLLMAKIMNGAFEYLHKGLTQPISPVTIYPVTDVENAFRLMQTGKHRGKIAISWTGAGVVQVLYRSKASVALNPLASYLLVGGLGGIGRSLARLLVRLGARYLCFIGRSGAKSVEAQTLVQELEASGVKTRVHSCDIANKKDLAKAFEDCAATMPPFRGVFQCAMALHDTLFERMSYDQWTKSLQPKVHGSWNLHTLIPQELDFFIFLSSFVGIFGHRTQSNYAAGATYEDALAHYRVSHGLKAVTIDLGIMRDVGVIAERGSVNYFKEWEEPFGIRESELHLLIQKIIVAETAKSSGTDDHAVLPPQIVTGLATRGAAQRAGIRTPYYLTDPRFSHLALSDISSTAASETTSNSKADLLKDFPVLAVTDPTTASLNLTAALVARVAKSLQTTPEEIVIERPLHTYGVDSLVAIEIVNWVLKETKMVITVFDVLASIPITGFAARLVEKCGKNMAG